MAIPSPLPPPTGLPPSAHAPVLTCEVDSDSHNDDNDAQDDEGDAEQPCQAAQPPCPIQVPLLHTTSRLQREGRETSGSLSISHVSIEAMNFHIFPILPAIHGPAGFFRTHDLGFPQTTLQGDQTISGQCGRTPLISVYCMDVTLVN